MAEPSPPVRIALYPDLHRPSPYLTAFRVRRLRADRVVIKRKSLALEYFNQN